MRTFLVSVLYRIADKEIELHQYDTHQLRVSKIKIPVNEVDVFQFQSALVKILEEDRKSILSDLRGIGVNNIYCVPISHSITAL